MIHFRPALTGTGFFLAWLFAACGFYVAIMPAQDSGKAKESPEQKAVLAYLKENTPSGTVEVVKWAPSKALENGITSIRLKYRTKNTFGALELSTDVFHIKGGKVVAWYKNNGSVD